MNGFRCDSVGFVNLLFRFFVRLNICLQDEKQPPWVYVKKYDAAFRRLEKMTHDLQTKTKLEDMFEEFPDILKRLSIFTHGVEIFETVDAKGNTKFTEFQLCYTIPSWDSRPEWLDEEDYTEASDAEKEEEDLNPPSLDPARKKRRKKR